MSARDDLAAHFTSDTLADQLLDAYRDEVLTESAEAYPGELAMLRGLVATLRVVAEHGDLTDVRKVLEEHKADDAAARAEGKSSRPPADATPGLSDRQARLLDAVRTLGGPWNTRRVLGLYALTDPGVVQRGTARRDLAELARRGHLQEHGPDDGRFYTLRRTR